LREKVGNFHLVAILRESLPSPILKTRYVILSQTVLAASNNIGSSQTPPSSSKPHPSSLSSLASDLRSSRACYSKIRRQACFADPAAPPLVLPYHRLLVFLASPSGLCVALVEEVAFIVAALELDQAFEAHADRSLFLSRGACSNCLFDFETLELGLGQSPKQAGPIQAPRRLRRSDRSKSMWACSSPVDDPGWGQCIDFRCALL
jgi:hypothetical protein